MNGVSVTCAREAEIIKHQCRTHTHTHSMQCVSCCNLAGSQGQELRCVVGSTLHIWRSIARIGCPPFRAERRTDGSQ